MPLALSTSKRKFHKILDSISNASNTSLPPQHDTKNASTTTLPASIESPAKRVKAFRPVSAFVPSSTRAHITPSRHSMIIQKPTTTTVAMNVERKLPNFAPWDREQFLDRLKTFRHVDKWMSKPEQITEVQWAKRGWSCVGKERVGCVGGCETELVIKLEDEHDIPTEGEPIEEGEDEKDDDDWRDKAHEQLVEKYAEMITTAHEGGCLWRRKGCDDTIYRLPLAHQAIALANLRERYESLATMADELPANLSTPPEFSALRDSPQLSRLLHPPQASSPSSIPHTSPPPEGSSPVSHPPRTTSLPTPPVNQRALTLALFGWRAETEHITGLAVCPACFRRLGLWLFKPRPSSSASEPDGEASVSRLDVVAEHRDYCPWINSESQNGLVSSRPRPSSASAMSMADKAGWEILNRAVTNAVRPRVDAWTSEGRESSQGPPDTPATLKGSFADSMATSTAVDTASRDEREKERWSRFKKIKQAFKIKKIGKNREKTPEKSRAVSGATTVGSVRA